MQVIKEPKSTKDFGQPLPLDKCEDERAIVAHSMISNDNFVKSPKFKALWLKVVGPPERVPKIHALNGLNLDHVSPQEAR